MGSLKAPGRAARPPSPTRSPPTPPTGASRGSPLRPQVPAPSGAKGATYGAGRRRAGLRWRCGLSGGAPSAARAGSLLPAESPQPCPAFPHVRGRLTPPRPADPLPALPSSSPPRQAVAWVSPPSPERRHGASGRLGSPEGLFLFFSPGCEAGRRGGTRLRTLRDPRFPSLGAGTSQPPLHAARSPFPCLAATCQRFLPQSLALNALDFCLLAARRKTAAGANDPSPETIFFFHVVLKGGECQGMPPQPLVRQREESPLCKMLKSLAALIA